MHIKVKFKVSKNASIYVPFHVHFLLDNFAAFTQKMLLACTWCHDTEY